MALITNKCRAKFTEPPQSITARKSSPYNYITAIMKRLFFISTLLLLALCANAQILYKISGKELKEPSYLLGTYHLISFDFIDKIPGYQEAWNNSKQVCGELVMEQMFMPENMAKLQKAMSIPGDSTIQQVMTAEQFAKYNAGIKSLLGMDLSNPLLAKQLGKTRPSLILEQFMCIALLQGREFFTFDQSAAIDNAIQIQAKKDNKPIGGFETFEEQLDILYGDITTQEEIDEVMKALDDLEKAEKETVVIFEAYKKQDLNAIADCAKTALKAEQEEKLVNERNANWLKVMPAVMQKQSTFFHVGAGHLINEKGLINQLRQMGYTVEAME